MHFTTLINQKDACIIVSFAIIAPFQKNKTKQNKIYANLAFSLML